MHLWDNRDFHGRVVIEKDKIRNDYLISQTLFTNQIISLKSAGIIDFSDRPDYFRIRLFGHKKVAIDD